MNVWCPDESTLTRALLGQLHGAPAEVLEEHLSNCSLCAETLQGLTIGDSVTASLRRRLDTEPEADNEALTELLERLRSLLPRLFEGIEPCAPPAPSAPSLIAASLEPPFRFLAAAKGPGEIGRLAHYRVLKLLGQGGMGLVFEAEDSRLHRRVALKVMLPKLVGDAESRARFILEARAAAIQHPRLVTVFEIGEIHDIPFLAMELLQGESLESRLRRQPGPYAVPVIVKVGRQIAEGLEAVHGFGFIHRDIKPSNIWLQAGTDEVRLLDFGLARAARADAPLTQPGVIVGTPGFLAPEQAAGKAVEARSDLFSLGAVLYLLSTGTMPFEGSDVLASLNALAISHPRPAFELNRDLPEALCHLITRLLSKQPALRPLSAREVIDILEAMQTTAAPPANLEARTSSVPSRKPLGRRVWMAGIAVCAAAVLSVFVAAWFNHKQPDAEENVVQGLAHDAPAPHAPALNPARAPVSVAAEQRIKQHPLQNTGQGPWVVLFCADDPRVWNTNGSGKHYAVPLEKAPENLKYLRLRRMDTGDSLILPLTRKELANIDLSPDRPYRWNGTNKEEFGGRHLGIAQGPRLPWLSNKGVIAIAYKRWEPYVGSGFGHKHHFNKKGQCYSWKGKEIDKTVFEIAASADALTADEEKMLLKSE
jgi:serine/threonine protein kinase